MNSPRPRQTPTGLSLSTHQRLNMYALAAGAAGVAALALPPEADAKIVYTPVNVQILAPHGLYQLDLNNDGVPDFTITNTTNFNTDQAFSNLFVKCAAGNAAVGTFVYRGFPPNGHAFNAGTQIGPFERFFSGAMKLVTYYYGGGGHSARGNFDNVTNKYLALEIKIGGHIHYGWARFTVKIVNQQYRIQAELTGYAYETRQNTPINAGQTSGPEVEDGPQSFNTPAPTTLGMLAMGAPALSMWRREDESLGMN